MTHKRKIIAALAAIGFAGAALLHAPLLRSMAAPLAVDQTTGGYDEICLVSSLQTPDGDRCYAAAGDLFKNNPAAKVLIVDPPPSRIVEAGALPSFGTIGRRELSARGVPNESIIVLRSRGIDDWAAAEALAGRLRERPRSSVVLLCAEFHSARLRAVLDDVLDPTAAKRVHVTPLSDRRFNRTNWWTTRCGVRELGLNWLMRLQGGLGGRAATPPRKNADAYIRGVEGAWREETP